MLLFFHEITSLSHLPFFKVEPNTDTDYKLWKRGAQIHSFRASRDGRDCGRRQVSQEREYLVEFALLDFTPILNASRSLVSTSSLVPVPSYCGCDWINTGGYS